MHPPFAGSGWVSGAIYTQAEYDAALQQIEAAKSEDQQYMSNLRNNETLPVSLYEGWVAAAKGTALLELQA